MMYNSRLAVAVKNNGKVLREYGEKIFLPFGAEYSLLIKNLNTVRAIVHVNIDGQEMVEGGLVVNANSEIELERMVKTNLNEGNRFKFIERNDAVEAHRGVKLEDGIIRIEYQFESLPVYRNPIWTYTSPTSTVWTNNIIYNANDTALGGGMSSSSNSVLRNASINNVQLTASGSVANSHPGVAASDFISQSYNDAGITVPGSISNQKFSRVSSFALENEKHVMIFKLLGETADNKVVRNPVTVKHKPKCVTCGTQNKAHAKFCTKCGTALEVFA